MNFSPYTGSNKRLISMWNICEIAERARGSVRGGRRGRAANLWLPEIVDGARLLGKRFYASNLSKITFISGNLESKVHQISIHSLLLLPLFTLHQKPSQTKASNGKLIVFMNKFIASDIIMILSSAPWSESGRGGERRH
jgi:hypothetical protein